jgi:4-hydroxythreonine-4-phosphate dehydrogenase
MSLPRIGITLGDPGGIGPEIVVKSLSSSPSLPEAHYIIFGSSAVLEEEEKYLGVSINSSRISLKEVPTRLVTVRKGAAYKENGLASFLFFEEAVKAAQKGEIQALVTAPISKRSWNLSGILWRGHTEYLQQFYPEAIMAFWSEKIKVALLSHHLPLKEALGRIRKNILLEFFRILCRSVERAMPGKYEYLVAGLNPHAGEAGILGNEEKDEIIPAVEEARRQGLKISGPYPPDIVFRMALGHSDTIVIALYHDQGLIAFKLEAFDLGVNVTLGMPFIRSSPDHGTAFDIAGKRMASPQSMIEAIKLAVDLSSGSF